MRQDLMYEKIAGSILGGAVGDALGGPLEGRSPEFIEEHFGGRIDTLVPYTEIQMGAANLDDTVGTYTDDTRLKNLLCQAIIEKKGRVTADDLAGVWSREMDPDNFFVTEQIAYARIKAAEHVRGAYTQPVNPAINARDFGEGALPACDANMIVSPLGLINAFDPFSASQDAFEVSLLFQRSYSAASCQPIAAAVAEAMRPEATWKTVLAVAVDYCDRFTAAFVQGALETAREAKTPERFKQLFYDRHLVLLVDPLEVVPAVFGLFFVCLGDYRRCVIEGANFGRDCDTIAGIVGSISGALHGIEAVPEAWQATVKGANPEPDLDAQIEGLHEAVVAEAERAQARADRFRTCLKP